MQLLIIISVSLVSFLGGYLINGTSSTEAKDAADIAAEVSRLSISDTAGSPNTISDTRGFFQKLWDSLKSFFYSDEGSSTTTPRTPDSVRKKRDEYFGKFLESHLEKEDAIYIARENFETLKYEIMNQLGWEERKDELPEEAFFREDEIAFAKRDEAEAAAELAAEATRVAEDAAEVAAEARRAAEVAAEDAAKAAAEAAAAVAARRARGGGPE